MEVETEAVHISGDPQTHLASVCIQVKGFIQEHYGLHICTLEEFKKIHSSMLWFKMTRLKVNHVLLFEYK